MQRDRVMESFRNGRTDILIATDVAARGIDVGNVEAVPALNHHEGLLQNNLFPEVPEPVHLPGAWCCRI